MLPCRLALRQWTGNESRLSSIHMPESRPVNEGGVRLDALAGCGRAVGKGFLRQMCVDTLRPFCY